MFKIDIKSWEPVSPERDYKIQATCTRDEESVNEDFNTSHIFLHALGENGWEYLSVASVADMLRIPEEGEEDEEEIMVRRKTMEMILPDPESLMAARDEIDIDSKALVRAIRAYKDLSESIASA